MQFDIVLLVGKTHVKTACIAIEFLIKNTNARTIFIITGKENFHNFSMSYNKNTKLIDENAIIPDVDLTSFEHFFIQREVNPKRAGWYFQQFLKMAACYLPEISEYYLIWDADTFLLRPVSFFSNDGKVLINVANAIHNHRPYFETYYKITGLKRSADFSFITEHLMIKKTYMQELIAAINTYVKEEDIWIWKIMKKIDTADLGESGFSEFETYGNYIMRSHPQSFELRRLKYFRYGRKLIGDSPNKYDYFRLSLSYTYVSFEKWDVGNKYLNFIQKIYSFLIWAICWLPRLTYRDNRDYC
jgi:hypothetical protein